MSSELSRLAQVSGLWLMGGAVFWFFVVSPATHDLEAALAQLDAAGRTRALAARLARLEREFMPESEAAAWAAQIVPAIEHAGRRLGVTIANITPHAPERTGAIGSVGLTLALTGAYRSVARLVDELERGERLVRVTRLELTRPGTASTVTASVQLEAFTRPGGSR